MSNTKELKEYLIGTKNSFLFNKSNNGKTIMLSGAWGAGKTHFWVNEIKEKLSCSLENKACIYVSLYGVNDIQTIRNEILIKAISETIGEDNKFLKKAISAFNISSKILSSISFMGVKVNSDKVSDSVKGFFEDKEMCKAIEYISDGGVICLDDFERKSANINLNDLFGFISQLAMEMNCKVVIILNSDVFVGKEANLFKTVKEKTINKFFNFSPSIDSLFDSIFRSAEKYSPLTPYKEIIINSIKETNELNARIYIQVFDNCLEWIEKEYSEDALRALVLCTVNFIKNHFIFEVVLLENGVATYTVLERFFGHAELATFLQRSLPSRKFTTDDFLHVLDSNINQQPESNSSKKHKSADYFVRQNKVLDENKEIIKAFHHYKYVLALDKGIDIKTFEKLNSFVQNGILI